MSQIKISNLTFSYDSGVDYIFKDVSLTLDTDWKLGLIGRNGKGKTTLLKLLMGKMEYKGTISSSVKYTYFPFDIKDKTLSVREIARGIIPGYKEWKLLRELSLLEVREDALDIPMEKLSMGEQTKVMIACMFLGDNNFLLIDEPTNHLDVRGRNTVSKYLNSKKGFILVSHDRAFVDGCTDHILSINRTSIDLIKGNYTTFKRISEEKQLRELSENERLKKEITRLEQSAKRTVGWAQDTEKTKKSGKDSSGLHPDRGFIGRKSAKLMKSAKNFEARRSKAITEKSGLLKDSERQEELIMRPLVFFKNPLITLREVSLFYGGKLICENISFDVFANERVCISGRNGSGKSTLLSLIMGGQVEHKGELIYNKNLIFSHVPQQFRDLEGSLYDICGKEDLDETIFFTNLAQLGVAGEHFDEDAASFSDGQKKKVLLAISITKSAHVYIWDEPLNYIDVISREQIEKMLLKYAPTLIYVEHDASFNENIATKRIELN